MHLAASPRLPGAGPWHALGDDLAMAGAVLSARSPRTRPSAPVLFAGSAAQYGMARSPSALRESDPLAPLSPYGAAKCVLELACTQRRS